MASGTILCSLQNWHEACPHLPDPFPVHPTFYYTLESVLREDVSSVSQFHSTFPPKRDFPLMNPTGRMSGLASLTHTAFGLLPD